MHHCFTVSHYSNVIYAVVNFCSFFVTSVRKCLAETIDISTVLCQKDLSDISTILQEKQKHDFKQLPFPLPFSK